MLITGFQGYGARAVNPAEEVAKALEGRKIGNEIIHGRTLPVSYKQLASGIRALISELKPRVTICLGLWPGEPVIRVERIAVNISSFEIPDNEGALEKGPIDRQGPLARPSGLPVDDIVHRLVDRGIPARPSSTAGNFLCNAVMYHAIAAAERLEPEARAGFIHVPYLPVQVADLMSTVARDAKLELHQRADLASMPLDMQIDAVLAACEASLEAIG